LGSREAKVKRVLVTGGAGFIGSHLVRTLHAQGVEVRVLDNFVTGHRENLAGVPVEVVEGDIRDPLAVRRAVAGVDRVFHLAAMISVPGSVADPITCYQVNVMGSLNLLWEARQAGVERVVMSSSAAVYGDATGQVQEDTPRQPQSPYAGSKKAMEGLGHLFSAIYGVETVSLRYFNVYGPRQNPHSDYAAVIPAFLSNLFSGRPPTIYGDGNQTRDFVFVGDVVNANCLAATAPGVAGAVYNIAGGREITILELARIMMHTLGTVGEPDFRPARPGDVRFSSADIRAACEKLGYQPTVGLSEGLALTAEWFRQSRQTPIS
jgi:UDP-glucose 4-epimerase